MKKTHAVAAALTLCSLAMASDALAISRVETPGQSCAAIQQKVAREGAVILRYPSKRVPGMTLYDRYVSNRASCDRGEDTERATVPARDTESCPVLKCYRPDPEDDLFIWPRFRRN